LGVPLADLRLIRGIAKRRCGAVQENVDAVTRAMIEKAAEYTGPRPTALERMLGLLLGVCWFDAHAGLLGVGDLGGAVRADRALKRLERVTLTLARVQKLKLPSLQINIGQNQQIINR
jgi:hypothetical protein